MDHWQLVGQVAGLSLWCDWWWVQAGGFIFKKGVHMGYFQGVANIAACVHNCLQIECTLSAISLPTDHHLSAPSLLTQCHLIAT